MTISSIVAFHLSLSVLSSRAVGKDPHSLSDCGDGSVCTLVCGRDRDSMDGSEATITCTGKISPTLVHGSLIVKKIHPLMCMYGTYIVEPVKIRCHMNKFEKIDTPTHIDLSPYIFKPT